MTGSSVIARTLTGFGIDINRVVRYTLLMETNERKWDDERYMDDAPLWMESDEARCWADGYNAAVRNCIDELDKAFKREVG